MNINFLGYLFNLPVDRISWLKLLKNAGLCMMFLFCQNLNAQTQIDSNKILTNNFQLNLFFTDANQYKFQIQELNKDSLLSNDTNMAILTLDSAILAIQNCMSKLEQNKNVKNNCLVLYVLNLNFQMIEMQNLFERLSDLGIQIKVKFL